MKKLFFILFFILPLISYSEEPAKKTSYEFRMEFFKEIDNNKSLRFVEPFRIQDKKEQRSVLLASLMSAVVPGACELYTGSDIQSGVFLGIEVASWLLNSRYNKKGDDQTAFFEAYANQNWSVVRYVDWIQRNVGSWTTSLMTDDKTRNEVKSLLAQALNPNTSLKPWERVNWALLNEAERKIGGGFSHVLPKYDDQQYYELIGKYPQFRSGWDDANLNDNVVYVEKEQVSAHFKWYSIERGKANDFYSVASTYASIIVINHVVSALDAALSAHLYNKTHMNISFDSRVTPEGNLTVNPNLNFRIDL